MWTRAPAAITTPPPALPRVAAEIGRRTWKEVGLATGGGAGLPVAVAASGTTTSGRHCAGAGERDAGQEARGFLGVVVPRAALG